MAHPMTQASSEVVKFPGQEVPSVAGASRHGTSVVVDGREIPKMHCFERDAETEFVIDQRFSYTFPREWAYLAASMAAQAMAIGAGYSHLGAENKDMPFAPEVHIITPEEDPCQ